MLTTLLASSLAPADSGLGRAPLRVTLSVNPSAVLPWSTHERNEQSGGKHGGAYYGDSADALLSYLERCRTLGVAPLERPHH